MHFRARGLKNPTPPLRTIADGGGAVELRWDDNCDPAAWAHLSLTEADLTDLLAFLKRGRDIACDLDAEERAEAELAAEYADLDPADLPRW